MSDENYVSVCPCCEQSIRFYIDDQQKMQRITLKVEAVNQLWEGLERWKLPLKEQSTHVG